MLPDASVVLANDGRSEANSPAHPPGGLVSPPETAVEARRGGRKGLSIAPIFLVRPLMAGKHFKLVARVSSSSPKVVRPVLEGAVAGGSVKESGDEFLVEAEMEGESAKDLNRSLLSALRKAEKRTRLRAEWTSEDGTTQRFFDYVLKKTYKGGSSS